MEDKKMKHLEFIQNVVKRMANNSFYLKGWSITLTAALIALLGSLKSFKYLELSWIPLIIFWLLDGFYLRQERLYHKLYADVRIKAENAIDFSMDASHYTVGSWISVCFSKTLIVFYLGILFVLILTIFIA